MKEHIEQVKPRQPEQKLLQMSGVVFEGQSTENAGIFSSKAMLNSPKDSTAER